MVAARRAAPAAALVLALAGAAPAPGCAALREADWGDVGIVALGVATLGLAILLDDDCDSFWDDDDDGWDRGACRDRDGGGRRGGGRRGRCR